MQKARRHPTKGLRLVVSAWFQVLFTRLLGVLFTFPSRYWFAIGHERVFSLGGWCPPLQTGFLRPRPTQDTHGLIRLRLQDYHLLWCCFPDSFGFASQSLVWVLQPRCGRNRTGLGFSPFARHYLGNHGIVFSSSGYLDVSVPRVGSRTPMDSAWSDVSSTRRVFPFGDPRIRACLQLPAAYRSLSRPSSPAHAKASTIRHL